MTKQELEIVINDLVNSFGFKKFQQRGFREGAMELGYQLRVRDELGRTKYFVTLSLYDWSKFQTPVEYAMEANLCFSNRDEDNPQPTIWVKVGFTNIDAVLKLSEKLWITHGSHYYDYD